MTREQRIAEFYRRTELHGTWTLADWLFKHGMLRIPVA